jgi:hypothetical protein
MHLPYPTFATARSTFLKLPPSISMYPTLNMTRGQHLRAYEQPQEQEHYLSTHIETFETYTNHPSAT